MSFIAIRINRTIKGNKKMEVILDCIKFNVEESENSLIFTECHPIGFRPTKFFLHKKKNQTWRFEYFDGWGKSFSINRIVQAKKFACENYGDDWSEFKKI